MESPTLQSIEAFQAVISSLQAQDIDNVFIVAALAQVLSDLSKETSID